MLQEEEKLDEKEGINPLLSVLGKPKCPRDDGEGETRDEQNSRC